MDDFEEDVVVLPVKGVRSFSYQDFGTLIAQPWVEERVRHYAASHELTSGGYGAIHLRAGSKTWAGGWEEGNHALTKTIREKFPSLETYLETVHKDLLSKQKRVQKESLRCKIRWPDGSLYCRTLLGLPRSGQVATESVAHLIG